MTTRWQPTAWHPRCPTGHDVELTGPPARGPDVVVGVWAPEGSIVIPGRWDVRGRCTAGCGDVSLPVPEREWCHLHMTGG